MTNSITFTLTNGRFAGLEAGEPLPDAKTIRLFLNILTKIEKINTCRYETIKRYAH